MHRFRRHTIPRLLPALVVSALLAACATASIASATTSSPAGLGGTWSGTLQRIAPRHVHHPLEAGARTGRCTARSRSRAPHGTYPINGKVNRNVISFGAVGVGATYSGSVSFSGKSMSGHWKSGDGGSGHLERAQDLVASRFRNERTPCPHVAAGGSCHASRWS